MNSEIKVVYVAGAYSGSSKAEVERNIARAREYGKKILPGGFAPIVPHAISAHWEEDPQFKLWTHDDWMQRFCLPLLDRCDAILMMPGWEHSKGSRMEYEHACKTGKPFLFDVNLEHEQKV